VEARARQDDALEEAIPPCRGCQLGLRHHIMASIIEDDDISELDYSEFEEGSSRSLSTIISFLFYFNSVVCR
jgi:hypothetical protein